ncbi:MAG: hypothetical protein IK015_04690 [Treponema sp.]|nr:hypothetical protein [Treponema sp.]
MTAGQFADKVFVMRQAQKDYFRTRSTESLKLSKTLEKEVDEILVERKNRSKNLEKQGLLFGS